MPVIESGAFMELGAAEPSVSWWLFDKELSNTLVTKREELRLALKLPTGWELDPTTRQNWLYDLYPVLAKAEGPGLAPGLWWLDTAQLLVSAKEEESKCVDWVDNVLKLLFPKTNEKEAKPGSQAGGSQANALTPAAKANVPAFAEKPSGLFGNKKKDDAAKDEAPKPAPSPFGTPKLTPEQTEIANQLDEQFGELGLSKKDRNELAAELAAETGMSEAELAALIKDPRLKEMVAEGLSAG